MSEKPGKPTEESALLKEHNMTSKLPKSIYSLYIGVRCNHVEKSTINPDLIIAINGFALLSYILQQALSVILFVVALLRLLDVKDDGMKLFAETALLSFDQKLLLFIFGLLMGDVLILFKVMPKWGAFSQLSKKTDSTCLKASNYAPYVIDLCCMGGMVIFMLVGISFSDLLIPVIVVWFILSIDEFCYDSLLTLCPDEIIESLLCSPNVDEICNDGLTKAKTTFIGTTIGWSLIVIMFIIFFYVLDE